MSNKLTAPGQLAHHLQMLTPKTSGKVHCYTALTLHEGGRQVHMGHGGQYNMLIGWGMLASHAELLIIETRNLLRSWALKERRIITPGGNVALFNQVEESETLTKAKVLQASILEQVRELQGLLRTQGEAMQAQMDAENLPKNGHEHPVEDGPKVEWN